MSTKSTRNNTLIVRRDPFREFDALIRQAFGPTLGTAPSRVTARELAGFTPAAEAFRDGEDAVVKLEIPGVSIDDVSVEIIDGRLVVAGERRDERAEDAGSRHLQEFRYGAFSRSFRLPARVAADDVTASYDAGVLTVRVAGAYTPPSGQKVRITTGATSPVAAESEDTAAAPADAEPTAQGQDHTA